MLTRRELVKLIVSGSNSFHTRKPHDDAPKTERSSEDQVYVVTRRCRGAAGEQAPGYRYVAWCCAGNPGERRQSESADLVANVDAFTRTIMALGAAVRRKAVSVRATGHLNLAMSWSRVSNEDRSTLLSHSSNSDNQECALRSGGTTGTQKQLKDEVSADLTNVQKMEEDRNANPAALVADEGKAIEYSR